MTFPEFSDMLSIAGLNLSLAGLAGLVAALRGGPGFTILDRFRLRQIVEFSFANALIALALVPLASTFDDLVTGVRIAAAAAIVYQVAYVLVLRRRLESFGLTVRWIGLAALNVAILAAAMVSVVTGSMAAFQWLLLLLLARPMLAFVLVLVSFERAD